MELQKTLGPWIGHTSKMIGCMINDVLQENGIDLTREQWLILFKLQKNDGLSQNQLAKYTDRDKTSLTRLINIMERKNLVQRIKKETDKRINLIFLTETGKQQFDFALPLFGKTIKKLQKGLSEKEINNTIKTLQKIQNNISKL